MKEKEAQFVELQYRCPETDQVLSTDKVRWSGGESECETCGSHGDVSVSFHCEGCGKEHSITLSSW